MEELKQTEELRNQVSQLASIISACVEESGGCISFPKSHFDIESSFVMHTSKDGETVFVVRPWLVDEFLPKGHKC